MRRKAPVKPEHRYYYGNIMGKMVGYMVTNKKDGALQFTIYDL